MSGLTYTIIQRWREHRNRRSLQLPYTAGYAFVGVGSHALQNLYPVLHYLGIRLKYVCCKSTDKLLLIERRFGVIATTSLDTILKDSDVKGVFVCTSPQSHFAICSRIVRSGKYVFVEKPPCQTLCQLKELIWADKWQRVMVGMQKRYSPFVGELKARLPKAESVSYTMSYHTGAYPEGNPFTDLFIHPVDMIIYLFGNAVIKGLLRTDRGCCTTVQLLFSHGNVSGLVELSTAHSWSRPEESLCINTAAGEYRLEQLEKLCYCPRPRTFAGIPLEKTGLFLTTEQILMERNGFSPLVVNNQLYSQGFFSEIKAFADMVEYSGGNRSALVSMSNTYELLASIQQ